MLHPTTSPHASRYHIDLTQNALIAILYDSTIPNLKTLLSDINITSPPSTRTFTSTLDKICAHDQLTELLKSMRPTTYTHSIINHTLQRNEIIDAYAYGHNLVHNNYLPALPFNLTTAIENGYYIKKIHTHILPCEYASCAPTNEILSHNTVEELHINSRWLQIDNPLPASLHTLILDTDACNIGDDKLQKCTSLTCLNIRTRCNITTCAPFAKSLRKLFCNIIGDDILKSCTMIEELHASYNDKITTCEPFAKSLKILYATHTCGIGDDGLKLCTSIEVLDASNNGRIRTCAPFAGTLRVLSIEKSKVCECSRKCRCNTKHYGMCDDGIRECVNIRELYASYNQDITTCAPFWKSLVMLSAGYGCGITWDKLLRCTLLRDVYAKYNKGMRWKCDGKCDGKCCGKCCGKCDGKCDGKNNVRCLRGIYIHMNKHVELSSEFPYRCGV